MTSNSHFLAAQHGSNPNVPRAYTASQAYLQQQPGSVNMLSNFQAQMIKQEQAHHGMDSSRDQKALAHLSSIKQEPLASNSAIMLQHANEQSFGGNSTGGKSSTKRKLTNPMVLDQSAKVTKLLQTSFKAIRLGSGPLQTGTDGELALFQHHLQSKIREGLPQELVSQQISQFAEKSNIQPDLISDILARTQAEQRIVKNAEKLACGRKFKGVPQSQIPFAPLSEKSTTAPHPEEAPNEKIDKFAPASKQLKEAEPAQACDDIFIDDSLCRPATNGISLTSLTNVKVEPLNTDFLQDEESTRSNFVAADNKTSSSSNTNNNVVQKPAKKKSAPKVSEKNASKQQKQEKVKKDRVRSYSDDSDSLFDFLEAHETQILARIPIKTNLQRAIEKDNQRSSTNTLEQSTFGAGPSARLETRSDQVSLQAQQQQQQVSQLQYVEEGVDEFENQEGSDFCQHPKAGQFLLNSLRYLVSMEDSCHINSVASAQQVGRLSLQCLTKPGFKIERLTVLQILIQTKNQTILKGFVRSGGLQAIHYWLEVIVDQRYEMEKAPSLLELQILQRILIVLSKLDLTVDILKEIKVGKLVNSVRLHPNADKQIRLQAEQLIGQWKQLVVDYKKYQQKALQLQQQELEFQQQQHQLYQQQMMAGMHPPLPQETAQNMLSVVDPAAGTLQYGHQPPAQVSNELTTTNSLHAQLPVMPPQVGQMGDDSVKQMRRSNVLSIFNIDPSSLAATTSQPSAKSSLQNDKTSHQNLKETQKQNQRALEQGTESKKQKKSAKHEGQSSSSLLQLQDLPEQVDQASFERYTQEANEDILMNDDDGDDQANSSQCKSSRDLLKDLERKRLNMQPCLPKNFVQEVLESVCRYAADLHSQKPTLSEVEKQMTREKFISAVSNPGVMENPVFAIPGQTEDDIPVLYTCDLEEVQDQGVQRREEKEKTDQILSKLLHILESDPDSIVENKDVFTQILAAVDKETISYIFRAPKIRKQNELPLPPSLEENKKLTEAVQKQLYQMIMCHYLSCNPILGNFATMENLQSSDKDKESFYKQAKEFFFTQPFKSPTPQKQYLSYSLSQAQELQQNQNPAAAALRCSNLMAASSPRENSLHQLPPSQANLINQQSLPQQPPFTPRQQQSSSQQMQQLQSQQHSLQQQQQTAFLQQRPSLSMAHGGFDHQHPANAFDTTGFLATQRGLGFNMMLGQFPPGYQPQTSRPKNYRTVPCRMYHGIQGCMRGETCHFIHDPSYQGVEIPREVLLRIRHENLQKFQTGQLSGIPVYQPGQQPQTFSFPHLGMSAPIPYGLPDQATTATIGAYQQSQTPPAASAEDIAAGKQVDNDVTMQNQVQDDFHQQKTKSFHQSVALIKKQQENSASSEQQSPVHHAMQKHQLPAGSSFATSMEQAQKAGHLSTSSAAMAAMSAHPYFNPQFTAQYYQQQEIYKQQQQAQLMANLNQQQQDQQVSEAQLHGDEQQLVNLGSIGMALPNSKSMESSAHDAANPSQSSVDYQLKLLQDKKTQETHRKLLEQIKSDKERKKNRYLEKYSRKLQGYQDCMLNAADGHHQIAAPQHHPQQLYPQTTSAIALTGSTFEQAALNQPQSSSVPQLLQQTPCQTKQEHLLLNSAQPRPFDEHGQAESGARVKNQSAHHQITKKSRSRSRSNDSEKKSSVSKRQLVSNTARAGKEGREHHSRPVDQWPSDERDAAGKTSSSHQHWGSEARNESSSAAHGNSANPWSQQDNEQKPPDSSQRQRESTVRDERERPLTWIEQEEQQRQSNASRYSGQHHGSGSSYHHYHHHQSRSSSKNESSVKSRPPQQRYSQHHSTSTANQPSSSNSRGHNHELHIERRSYGASGSNYASNSNNRSSWASSGNSASQQQDRNHRGGQNKESSGSGWGSTSANEQSASSHRRYHYGSSSGAAKYSNNGGSSSGRSRHGNSSSHHYYDRPSDKRGKEGHYRRSGSGYYGSGSSGGNGGNQ